MRRLSILGSTGSIGKQTLEVCRKAPADFTVEGLSCGSDTDTLYEQIKEFRPEAAAVSDPDKGGKLAKRLKEEGISTEIYTGPDASNVIAELPSCDTVVGAIVGFAGLRPVYHAIRAGKTIALANKETLVSGGDFIMPLAKEKGVDILPVDSEHSAIWQCLRNGDEKNLDRILITASGGPFRGKNRDDLLDVTCEKALAHPTWKMGKKITVDSATLANKGLEVIEARRLFDTNVQNISVVVHPESLIHSLVRTSDGILYAQISEPDMRHPIMGALCWPEYADSGLEKFSLAGRSMSFYEPRRDDFPLLGLAESAADKGASYTIAFNAADEIAAWAFIDNKIGFLKIAETVQKTLAADWTSEPRDFDDVFEADKKARAIAEAAL